ncbi:MAG: serine/threonine-protein kinase, partial [Polyangiales bacterium]
MKPRDLAAATPEHPVRVGRYDVIGLIRGGGMGTVHDAIDRDHGTRVALKTLHHLAPASLLRFKSEFRSVADLSHPSLVSLYELSCQDDLWFFTMERIDGSNFLAWLRGGTTRKSSSRQLELDDPTVRGRDASTPARQRLEAIPTPPRSIPQLRDAFAQLVRGVRALHAADLLHLDIKPSNVLVDRAGRVVIVDFGLVRALDRSEVLAHVDREPTSLSPGSEPSSISGTPAWMAPEQYSGEGIGPASDWYAVGLMLYAALTGVPAFAHGSIPLLWFAKRTMTPTPPQSLLRDLPSDLCDLAMALIRPDPAQRPTGDEIAALLAGAAPEVTLERRTRSRIVGRKVERERLKQALANAERFPIAVHVVGPSGVGKTTLLEELAVQARSALVLRGRCYERESVPYKAFDGPLDQLAAHLAERDEHAPLAAWPAWLPELARVFPVLGSVPSIAKKIETARAANVPLLELRRRAVEALRALVKALAAERPVVFAIDDLQWADADSANMLVRLLEHPAPRGLVIAVSFRAAEASANPDLKPYFAALQELGATRLETIEVGPLPRDDAAELARETLAGLGIDRVAAALSTLIAREAGGVPFYVEELAHHVAQSSERTGTTVTLDDVLARRMQALAPAERALVETLAVAGSPIPLSSAFAAAGIAHEGVLRAIWSLRAGHFVRSTGSSAGDRVEVHHDRMRESLLRQLPRDRVDALHLSIGRELVRGDAQVEPEAWLFAAVRHLNAVPRLLVGAERANAAELNLQAGRRARRSAAFPLAFECFHAGTKLLESDAFENRYDLAIALHGAAADAAYLSGAFAELDAHVATVKSRGRTVLDQLVAREAEIDACIARSQYDVAVDRAIEALQLLGVELPGHPTEADTHAEIVRAMEALARVGCDGLRALPVADDPSVVAAMRIQTRISSAAYFGRPALFPVVACRMVSTSVERGISPATPYALSVYGIVLNAMGKLRDAHEWAGVALDLIGRFDDRSLEARTRHVVHDLVDTWIPPLASTLDDLRAVVAIGKENGDLEFAGYAAHAYVHNAFYAGRKLGPLLEEALELGAFMRGCGQVNALHVHVPFEQLLRCFTGRTKNPARLDGDGFSEEEALEAARASGSRSAQHIVRLLMGIVRYHFGSVKEASACLELARPFLDGVVSTWHTPMFHQYAALAIHGLPKEARAALREVADASLAALRAVAAESAVNFAHRVTLVEAESARADGAHEQAIALAAKAASAAEERGWSADAALAHTIAARAHQARGQVAVAKRELEIAEIVLAQWGAI